MRIVVFVNQGLVQEVLASEPVEVLLVDQDVRDEVETREVTDPAGKKFPAALVDWDPTVDPSAVAHYFTEF